MEYSPLKEPVLILNANFEPLHVSSTKRALGLIFAGKAEVIIDSHAQIHTSSKVFTIPSIIRLSKMIRRPRPRISLTKREVIRRDNHTCQYCGRKNKELTIDHIKPRHAGGPHTWLNVVAACPTCNRKKGGYTLDQIRMPLRRPPFEPKPTAMYRFGRYTKVREEWQTFLEGW